MRVLRALLLNHPRAAVLALLLVLSMKALVPAGFMLSGSFKTFTVTVCDDETGALKTMEIEIPVKAGHDAGKHADGKASGKCAFSSLSFTALGGVDAPLLALAFAFILLLGLAPAKRLPFGRIPYLLPPLRGPPATA